MEPAEFVTLNAYFPQLHLLSTPARKSRAVGRINTRGHAVAAAGAEGGAGGRRAGGAGTNDRRGNGSGTASPHHRNHPYPPPRNGWRNG